MKPTTGLTLRRIILGTALTGTLLSTSWGAKTYRYCVIEESKLENKKKIPRICRRGLKRNDLQRRRENMAARGIFNFTMMVGVCAVGTTWMMVLNGRL